MKSYLKETLLALKKRFGKMKFVGTSSPTLSAKPATPTLGTTPYFPSVPVKVKKLGGALKKW